MTDDATTKAAPDSTPAPTSGSEPTGSPATATAATATEPGETREAMVRLEHVVRAFKSGTTEIRPVDGLSLTVYRGEFVALMGPSGSGKSTLMNIICGIDQPTEGKVMVAGEDIPALSRSALARWRNAHLGVIFQQYHLVPVLTAFENVELPLRLRRLSRQDRARRVNVAMEAVGLSDRATHLPGQLSGGQQQRVAIARAFVTDPDLIIADEPTGNLDRQSVQGALRLLQRLHSEFGKTLIMVTHDASAASIATRTYHLADGRLRDAPEETGPIVGKYQAP